MVDYSKWKNIEISDDEDETHPNIDTQSLFRWRHQARVERMEELDNQREQLKHHAEQNKQMLKLAEEKLKKGEGDVAELQNSIKQLKLTESELKKKEQEFESKEKKQPWNVDTISKPGFAKTVINKNEPRKNCDDLSEEEREENMKKFLKENEKLLKQFGMLRKYDDSKKFLTDNNHLACENTANFLVIWCIELEMEGKTELMYHVAHQCICMQYILQLAKQLDLDPRACIGSFFSRIQIADFEYKGHFNDEVEAFKERIKKRAAEKIEIALEEERKARLGPGGLDPHEVFETLPVELQQCFESRDISLLQEQIAKMPTDEAKYHMKRCIDSGLWIADASTVTKNDDIVKEDDGAASTADTDDDDEDIYIDARENSNDMKDSSESSSTENK